MIGYFRSINYKELSKNSSDFVEYMSDGDNLPRILERVSTFGE